jgi:hypothetical protein
MKVLPILLSLLQYSRGVHTTHVLIFTVSPLPPWRRGRGGHSAAGSTLRDEGAYPGE